MTSRRTTIVALVGVCVLSAAIGSGITLLAKTGPEGPPGAQGSRGPQGPQGFSASEDAGENAEADVINLEDQVDELESRLEEVEGMDSLVEELGYEVTENAQTISSLCRELDVFC